MLPLTHHVAVPGCVPRFDLGLQLQSNARHLFICRVSSSTTTFGLLRGVTLQVNKRDQAVVARLTAWADLSAVVLCSPLMLRVQVTFGVLDPKRRRLLHWMNLSLYAALDAARVDSALRFSSQD